MIYLTGDTHAGIDMHKLSNRRLKWQNSILTENDYLIITGDFGFPFYRNEAEEFELKNGHGSEYAFWMKWWREKPYTVLFIDGNHDNHDWWAEQDITDMFGGKVQIHPHAPNVIHLMRGEVYTIEGRTFFTFGGAASTDKEHRTEGLDWWADEEARYWEIDKALKNLDKVDNKVDYIITHTMPKSLISSIPMFSYRDLPCSTAKFLDEVLSKVKYDKWFCGHFHMDLPLYEYRMFILYDTVTALPFFEKILNQEDVLDEHERILKQKT